MDLLTGYGSDASEGDNNVTSLTDSEPVPTDKQGVTARQPEETQRRHQPQGGQEALRDEGDFESRNGGLWAKLPRPTAATFSAPSTSGLATLPPPSGTTGLGLPRKVTMQLPFRKELLAAALDSDDEDEPVAKRVKATVGKSRLMDFLPPPKYNKGTTRPLDAGSHEPPPLGVGNKGTGAKTGPTSGTVASGASMASSSGALPADFFSGETAACGNEAYRISNDGDGPGFKAYSGSSAMPHSEGAYYGPSDANPSSYYTHSYVPVSGSAIATGSALAATRASTATSEPPEPEDLIAEALRAEQQRASKRGGGAAAVKLVEINAKDLTQMDPAAREAANSARDALGPEYALSLRRSAAPYEGSKMARRKHQIGTLLFNARMQELEQLEKRTQGQKSKAETAAKYGW